MTIPYHESSKCMPLTSFMQDSGDIYQRIKAAGYTDRHKSAILAMLQDLKVHSTDEVMAQGGKQYNARIHELRGDGWEISCVSMGGGKYGYLLKDEKVRFK